jgi:acetyl esterase/lipase
MSIGDRLDPEVAEGLKGFFEIVGPGGLDAIADLGERRERLAEVMAMARAATTPTDDIETSDHLVPGPAGAPEVPIRVYRPKGATGLLPGIFDIHGGGMTTGSIESEDIVATALAEGSGCVVVSVEYRLAPEHPDPAPIEDCYAALVAVADRAAEFGIDRERLLIYGASAGGGLAAGTTLMARDRGDPAIFFQMLIYPMIDDRLQTSSCQDIVDAGVFDRDANIEAWAYLLGDRAGGDDVSSYAAPAREKDLSNLPPTYIDVGELDGLRDEAIHYALGLMQAGIPVELHVYPGAVHGSEVIAPESKLAARVREYRRSALERTLAEGA